MSLHIAHEVVGLPPLEKIPTPATRAALEKAIDIVDKRKAAHRERDFTMSEVRRLERAEPMRRGRAIADGVDPGESPVAAAEAAEKKAQADLNDLIEAEKFVLVELRAAMVADRDVWSVSAAADAQKALIKLATAVRMASEARNDLHDSIGILGMHRGHERSGGGPLAMRHPRESSHFDIDAGIEGLRLGLSGATHELAALKPGKAKKADKGTEAVAE